MDLPPVLHCLNQLYYDYNLSLSLSLSLSLLPPPTINLKTKPVSGYECAHIHGEMCSFSLSHHPYL